MCKTVKSSPLLLFLNLLWTWDTGHHSVWGLLFMMILFLLRQFNIRLTSSNRWKKSKFNTSYCRISWFLLGIFESLSEFFFSHFLSKQEHNWRVGTSESIFEPNRKPSLSFILSLLFPPMYTVLASQKIIEH